MKHNLKLGVGIGLFSTLFYSSLTAMTKAYGHEFPLPMLVFIQSLISFILFFPVLFSRGIAAAKKTLQTNKIPLHVLRAVLSLALSYLLFYSIQFIPLVNAMLLANTAPLLVPFIAYFFLSQKINHKLWLPIFIGFAGVALVLHPDGRVFFQPGALIALGAALSMAATMVTVRKLGATDTSETITFYFFLLSSIIAGIIAIKFWMPLSPRLWLILISMGAMYFVSQYLFTIALNLANVQLISSLAYMNVVNSAVISAVVWHHFPTTLATVGILLTVAGGILCIRTEYQHRKRIVAEEKRMQCVQEG